MKTRVINEKTPISILAIPIFFEIILQMCVGFADTAMISRYSESALNGISNANNLLNLLVIMFNIIAIATGVIVSQYLGANKHDEIPKVYTVAIVVNFIFSLIVSAVLFFFGAALLDLMKIPDAFRQDAVDYMRIVGGTVFMQSVFMTVGIIFKSNGIVKPTLYISIMINVVNIVGNWIFLYGPLKGLELGTKGVAISSITGRTLGLIAVIIIFKKMINVKISLKNLKPFPFDILKKMLKVGLPSAGEQISWNASQIVVTTTVNIIVASRGEFVSTTKYLVGMIVMFSFVYSNTIASATQIIIGHLVGAGKEDEASKRLTKSLYPALFVTLGMSILLYILSPVLFRAFGASDDVIKLGKTILIVDIILELGRCSNLVVIQSLRAAGDVIFPVAIGLVSMWVINAGMAYVFGVVLDLGLVGVWIALAMDEVVRGILVYIRWIRGSWRGKKITN